METSLFDYDLPENLIADRPAETRDEARLLRLCRKSGDLTHHRFRDVVDLLRPGDLLVVNDTRVFPARLYGRRSESGGRVEALLLRPGADGAWWAMVRPGRKIRKGETLEFGEGRLRADVVMLGGKGERLLRFDCAPDETMGLIEELGVTPLPPYILKRRRRLAEDAGLQADPVGLEDEDDKARYQTVYAGPSGSVAAPTAGLHFTEPLLERLRQRGHGIVKLTLHVGPGTFLPVTTYRAEDHPMHLEEYSLSAQAAREINAARAQGRRIVPVGTTTVRVLETLGRDSVRLRPGAGSTDLMIAPGFEFRYTDAMITNFHLPRSTLLMLVSALAGRSLIMNAYREAIEQEYRFYSYGDAMLID